MPSEQEPPDLAWIETSDHGVARESLDVLAEVLREWNLRHVPQSISPYPQDTDDMVDFGPGYDYHLTKAAQRWDVVTMLVDRHILISADPVVRRTDAGPEPISITIESDEATVRHAAGLLRARLSPAPPAPPAPAPPPPAPSPSEARPGVTRLYVESAAKASGTESGKWITRVVIGLILLGLMAIYAWFRTRR